MQQAERLQQDLRHREAAFAEQVHTAQLTMFSVASNTHVYAACVRANNFTYMGFAYVYSWGSH
jgi:hypothetical protein